MKPCSQRIIRSMGEHSDNIRDIHWVLKCMEVLRGCPLISQNLCTKRAKDWMGNGLWVFSNMIEERTEPSHCWASAINRDVCRQSFYDVLLGRWRLDHVGVGPGAWGLEIFCDIHISRQTTPSCARKSGASARSNWWFVPREHDCCVHSLHPPFCECGQSGSWFSLDDRVSCDAIDFGNLLIIVMSSELHHPIWATLWGAISLTCVLSAPPAGAWSPSLKRKQTAHSSSATDSAQR